LTSLEKKITENETYKEICIRHKRSEWDYFAIAPNTNIYNDSISQPAFSSEIHTYSKGWIDLITPMTIGTKNIVTAKRVDEISQVDLEKIIAAHVARMGFQQIGGGGCLGIGARASNSVLAQGFQKILNITKALLHASENKEATQGENERRYAEVIGICNDLIVTYPPSPPHEAINPLDIPSEIDLHDQLPTRIGLKRRRRRNTKSNGTCNDGQSETRRTDDPNGGGGPSGGGPSGRGPNGGGHVTSHTENKPRVGKSTGGESKTSAKNASPVHCANRNLASEWTDADWQLIEYEYEDEDDETSTEEISEEPWQLLDYELSYCDSESDSYISSSELDGPDVESWRESLPDPAQTSSTEAAVTVQNNRMLMIMRYLDALRTYRRGEEGMLDSRAQGSPDKSLLSSSEM
jgi:hypothetical protein